MSEGAMDSTDKDLGWEDVSTQPPPGSMASNAVSGQIGEGSSPSGLSDAMTSAMVNHFARELTQGPLSLWPQLLQLTRQYFNVTHGYVLRKLLWLLVPLPSEKKKTMEGELGGDKDWMVRIHDGLQVDLEEPDLYIPTMGFITYVILCGVVQGVQERFDPDTLSTTVTFAFAALAIETGLCKLAFVTAGAAQAPVLDLATLLGYKYVHLSLHLLLALLLGFGRRPEGHLFRLLALALQISCGVALWQALRRLVRMQPVRGQECMNEAHKLMLKGLPVLQAVFCWVLLPSWPKGAPPVEAAVAAAVASPSVTVAATVATTVAAAAAEAVGGN